MARPVIIDCDPGTDDCIALMAAFASPEDFEILGVSVVAGNVPVETCARNALAVAALAGRSDIQVYQGCHRPLQVDPVFAEHIHGESGLGDARLPEPENGVQEAHAVDFLVETLSTAEPASITLIPTGPLTNIAAALMRSPDCAAGIKQIVLMGGARSEGGNITPSAEFNIYADPHAAAVVFACGRPIIAIGLDATLQLRCSPERHARLKGLGNAAGAAAAAMVDHVTRAYGQVYGPSGAALHDPCTIAYCLAPELFESIPAHIQVECESALTRGHTSVGVHMLQPGQANAQWVTGLQSDKVYDLLLERIGRL